MYREWIKVTISLLFVAAISNPVLAFNDSELHELLAQIDSAAEARDVTKIAHLLSDRVSITIEMPTPQGNTPVELDKQQYLRVTQQGWDAIGPSYKYTRLQTNYESDGTRAQVVSIVREEYHAGGQRISSETLEIADLEVENGRLVVVKVVGQMHIKGEPIPKPSI
ncbi:MAG: hypothetical protein ABW092_09225 [Candidatus Thiodiazotropha sp.]